MKDFKFYLDKIGEIGFVDENLHSIISVSGLPNAHPGEIIMTEDGDLGQVFSLGKDVLEVLLFTKSQVKVGTQVVRTGENTSAPVGMGLLGKTINPLGMADTNEPLKDVTLSVIDKEPPKIMVRAHVQKPMETGVSLVDLVVPLSKGQRELVIGDRKTGKTEFLRQTLLSQARRGTICIYAVIGQKKVDTLKLNEFLRKEKIEKNTIVIAASSSESAGLIYLTPYTAMTVAEFFRDQGMDVLLILDDMTTHARVYREISLLARRFPGRSSYPGDIFYLHARLIERAGNFKKGSITALPVAESLLGDLSGYIQTNLMAMTDGHIFFDIDLYNAGKRPAVNAFLSVTRVGHQTQTPLLRDLSRELTSFLVTYERMKQFMHFGAEIGATARNILSLGEKIDVFFNQGTTGILPININVIVIAGLWAGIWSETKVGDLKREFEQIILAYSTDDAFNKKVSDILTKTNSFSDLVTLFRREGEILTSKLNR